MSQQAQETVVVPREPTPEMIEAAHQATPVTFLMDADPTNIWLAMTRAAPVSPDSDLLKEAVGHITRLCDWIEHEVGAELPYVEGEQDARAFLSKVEERGHD